MVIRMDNRVVSPLPTEYLNGPVCNPLIAIHVVRRTGPGLKDIHDKMLMPLSFSHLPCRLHNRPPPAPVEFPGIHVHKGSRLFNPCRCTDKLWPGGHTT